MNKILRILTPPIFPLLFRKYFKSRQELQNNIQENAKSGEQDLDIYWTEDMANQLENWGKDHTWNEIECLLINCKGKILDIACGTGVNIKSLSKFPFLNVHGFDISDLLLEKAKQKGIDSKLLKKADATNTNYLDSEFEYSYSIGSLEHFTEEGIFLFLSECSRYTAIASFHMIPVSRDNNDHGWIKRGQSYYNNSIEWWMTKFEKNFSKVYVINSGWKDADISIGKWFICFK